MAGRISRMDEKGLASCLQGGWRSHVWTVRGGVPAHIRSRLGEGGGPDRHPSHPGEAL